MSVRKWLNDLTIGVRLAVGSGRTSAARLALSAVGIAVAVFVLLVGASVGSMSAARDAREVAVTPDYSRADVAPTIVARTGDWFRGEYVKVTYVHGTGPDSPRPAALPALPKPGEMYASAALVDLLRSAEGELLRPRLPDRIVGTLDQDMVVTQGDLVAWVGADETLADDVGQPVYRFGLAQPVPARFSGILLLVLIGAVVLLLPVFVFVSSASRIAGAERDRRLSALRLVGAGAPQVRRIAAAESLVSAVAGLALGAVLFLVGRRFAEDVDPFGQGVYVSDVVPSPVLVVVIVLLIPVLSVLTALVALRRTIIEPLGVVRQGKPVRRRAWWRLAMVALGVVLLTTQLGLEPETDQWAWAVTGGAVLLLIGVPVLLPWLVEWVTGHVKGGPSSWLLAVRRLQLDSGTSARVVGGVAVVLAGAITLQTVLLTFDGEIGPSGPLGDQSGTVEVGAASSLAPDILHDVRNADGVLFAHPVLRLTAYEPGKRDTSLGIAGADCAALRELANLRDCRDGDVFVVGGDTSLPAGGTTLEFRRFANTPDEDWDPANYEVTARWTVPPTARKVELKDGSPLYATIIVTPGALEEPTADDSYTTVVARVNQNLTADQLERIRNAVTEHRWKVFVSVLSTGLERNVDQGTYTSIRNALYAGSIFTLMLAGVSMLVLALEHIRERRRSLAVLAASGVPWGVLARSLLWQVALPIVLGVAVALLIGTGLAALIVRLTDEPLAIDWPGVALLCAGAVALTLLVSAMTLPFLKSATRLTTIRTE